MSRARRRSRKRHTPTGERYLPRTGDDVDRADGGEVTSVVRRPRLPAAPLSEADRAERLAAVGEQVTPPAQHEDDDVLPGDVESQRQESG
jgi:hypothetical protein